YGNQLGITFVEHEAPNNGENDQGFRIVTGDMRALDETLPIGVGGVLGVAGENMAIMDLQDFQQADDDRYGGPWFQTAMHEIGHLLGLGHTDELAAVTVMNDDPSLTPSGQTAEAVYPGDHDLVHGRQLFRPDSTDIDLYRVPIDSTGVLRIETFAERQQDSSLLDTVVTLYREVDGVRELVARNDDYFSEDSRIELSLNAGTYFIGVSASGNDSYNPEIEDSGYGGKTQGRYDLQLTFRPDAHNAIKDLSGVALDGDGDGISGGVFNFWFQTAIPAGVTSDPDDPRVIFVDKLASGVENGALAFPFGTLGAALAEADPGDIVRMVGNSGADGDASTLSDNVAYQFGYNRINGAELEDGNALLVPQGITVMIDAGAIVKSRRGRI
ncbi:MAG: hypothetical protein QGH11_13645, partial [Pirellulaceae bacterium]|nr:hypothetical protein [Pirellulaceae bacterium]